MRAIFALIVFAICATAHAEVTVWNKAPQDLIIKYKECNLDETMCSHEHVHIAKGAHYKLTAKSPESYLVRIYQVLGNESPKPLAKFGTDCQGFFRADVNDTALELKLLPDNRVVCSAFGGQAAKKALPKATLVARKKTHGYADKTPAKHYQANFLL